MTSTTINEYARYCNDVALLLYGTPNRDKCTSAENRWGNNGSLSVKVATGEWYDFEARKGGSTLELIMHHFEHMKSKDAAVEWFNLVRDKLTNGETAPVDEVAPISGNRKANGGSGNSRVFTFEGAAERYPYHDAESEVAFVAARYEPKDFRPWRPDGCGGWIKGLDGVKLVPYRLPELIEAVASEQTVHVLEGERDVEAARNLGLVATCNQGGCGGGWRDEYNDYFRGADVVVHTDNDDGGRKHQAKVVDALRGVAKRVRAFDLKRHWPAVPLKGDLTDWVAQGGTREELDRFIFDGKLPFLDFSNWDNVLVPRQEWAVEDRIPTEQTTLFSGEGAAGKSLIQLQLSVAHVLGKEWLGIVPEFRPAWFIDAEDGEKIIHKRLADILRYYGATFAAAHKRGLHVTSLAGQDAVLATADRKSGKIEPTPLYYELLEKAGDIKPAMIGIASSANVFAGNEISRTEVQQFIALLTRIAMVGRSAVNLISHPSLVGISSGTGLSGSTQWHNAVRARFYLRSVKAKKKDDDEEEPDHNLRVLEFHKNNYGPVSSRIFLRWDDGLFLPYRGDTVDLERQLQAVEVFLAVLTKLTKQGQDLSPHKTSPSGWAPTIITKHPDAAGFRQHEMEAAMQRLLDVDRIHIAERGSGARAKKYLFPGPKVTEA